MTPTRPLKSQDGPSAGSETFGRFAHFPEDSRIERENVNHCTYFVNLLPVASPPNWQSGSFCILGTVPGWAEVVVFRKKIQPSCLRRRASPYVPASLRMLFWIVL